MSASPAALLLLLVFFASLFLFIHLVVVYTLLHGQTGAGHQSRHGPLDDHKVVEAAIARYWAEAAVNAVSDSDDTPGADFGALMRHALMTADAEHAAVRAYLDAREKP